MGSSEKLPAITLWFSDAIKVLMEYWYVPVVIVNISDGAYSNEIKEYLEFVAKKNLAIISKKEIINGIIERTNK